MNTPYFEYPLTRFVPGEIIARTGTEEVYRVMTNGGYRKDHYTLEVLHGPMVKFSTSMLSFYEVDNFFRKIGVCKKMEEKA